MCWRARTHLKPDYFVRYSLLRSAVNKRLCNPSPPLPIPSQWRHRERLCNRAPIYTLLPVFIIAAGLDAARFVSPSSATLLLFSSNVIMSLFVPSKYTCPFIQLLWRIHSLLLHFYHLIWCPSNLPLSHAAASTAAHTQDRFVNSHFHPSLRRITPTNAWEHAVTSLSGPLHGLPSCSQRVTSLPIALLDMYTSTCHNTASNSDQ